MENTMEIMVNENKEVMEEAAVEVVKKLDIKELAKKGGKVVAVGVGAYTAYKVFTKVVPAAFNGGKKLITKWTKKDVVAEEGETVDVDNYTEVNDIENDEN